MSRPLRGGANGRVDALITTASSQIARHRDVDLQIAERSLAFEQGRSPHDLAGLAVAALRHVQGSPGDLHRVLALRVEAFDRDHRLARYVGYHDRASADSLALQMDRTGAAKTKAATKLRSGKAKLVAQEPHERHRGIALEFPFLPIYLDIDHRLLLSTRPRARTFIFCTHGSAADRGLQREKADHSRSNTLS